MYETLLVATDGSEPAGTAVEHAVELGSETGATVHVLAVVDTEAGPMTFDVDAVSEIDDRLSELTADIVSAHGDRSVELVPELRRGQPAITILEYADEIDADLIVVGQRGGNTLKRAILGSTTDRLARETEIPLQIVPDRKPAE